MRSVDIVTQLHIKSLLKISTLFLLQRGADGCPKWLITWSCTTADGKMITISTFYIKIIYINMAGLCRYLLLCNLELDKHIYWADAACIVHSAAQAIWYVILCCYDADTSLRCRNDGVLHDLTSLQHCSTRHQHGHRGQTGSAAQQHSILWTRDTGYRRHHIIRGYGTFKLSIHCHLQCCIQ